MGKVSESGEKVDTEAQGRHGCRENHLVYPCLGRGGGRKHGHGPGHPLRLAANAGTAMPQDATHEVEGPEFESTNSEKDHSTPHPTCIS